MKETKDQKGYQAPACNKQKKPCFGRGKCDETTGKCTCSNEKFSGDLCDKVANFEFPACAKEEIPCNGVGRCDFKSKKCDC